MMILLPIEILWIVLFFMLTQPQILWSMGSRLQQPQSKQQLKWSPRTISTKVGLVKGLLFQKAGYDDVEVYLGLPYASAPVGSLRLMPPVSGSPWSGTKMNSQPAPSCPQRLPNIANETEALKRMPRGRLIQLKRLLPLLRNQSEDCLYLNVYVPASNGKTNGPYAVLVHVHGEDFAYGSAGHPYDPSMFVSQMNVIIVTLNYRVGILGFLNANSEGFFKSPANFAILDIIAALHWTQENIGAFGGDRTNVTLMGHGKGAIYVNFLMISSAVPTGLLFHRVILMSGSALSPIVSGLSNGPDLAKRFADKVKCPTQPPSSMLHCLRQVPLQHYIESELWGKFGPSDDGVIIEEGIRENVLRDRLSHYPLLFGVTKAEMLPSLSEHDAVYGLENEKRREILRAFVEKYYSFHRNEIMAAAIHEYTDWERPIQHPISVRDETLDALADAQVVAPLIKVGDLHSNSRSYFYVFEYQSKMSDYQQRLGCVHGEDLVYVFGVPLYFYGNEAASSSTTVSHGRSGGGSSSLDGGGGITNSGSSSSSSISSNGGNINSVSGGSSNAIGNRGGTNESEDKRQESSGEFISLWEPGRLGFFSGNFTRNEVQLAQNVMQYWANFIKTGNPNDEKYDADSNPCENLPSSSRSSSSTSSNEKSSKQRVIDWPCYDRLYKKYLTIDSKPKLRSHYRAHKLSFWLHLVPDLQRNGYGVPSGHHNVNQNSITSSSSSSSSSIPVHPNSGLVILPPEDPVHNSSTPPPPTIQLVGPPMWEHNPNKQRGNFFQSNSDSDHGDADGFHMYSTALSVTIAIGCSLLILNILIFAAFYYQRDKRRTEEMEDSPSRDPGCGMSPRSHSSHDHSGSHVGGGGNGGMAYSKADITSLPRRKENGQIVQMGQQTHHHHHHAPPSAHQQQQQHMPMPNICGELPPLGPNSSTGSDSGGDSYGGAPTYSSQTGTLKKQTGRPQGQQQQQQPNFEMTMPDAIISAAMMNVQYDDSPECGSIKGIRRSSLTVKDQNPTAGTFSLTNSGGRGGGGGGGGSIQYDSGSRTVPRPPKRTTPTVKFGPETNLESPTSGASPASSTHHGPAPPPGFGSQTLKPSLKKSLNYSGNADELRV